MKYLLAPWRTVPRKYGVLALLAIVAISVLLVRPPKNAFNEGLSHAQMVSLFKAVPGSEYSATHSYVSISQYAPNEFLISNYTDLLLFDSDSSLICPLIRSADDGYGLYNPTGVFVGRDRTVYVANYKGNNILEIRVNSGSCELRIIGAFASPNTIGPENVFVDDKGSRLVSANYDGGTVTAFDLKTKAELWSTAVPQAHGVAVINDRVYATSLTERGVYELDLSTGSILRKKGKLGWNPADEEYLWPTSIYPLNDHQLVIADAHTGYISFLETSDLGVRHYIGGNGPTYKWLNYPYAAVPIGDELAIMQAMRREILFIDIDSLQVTRAFRHSGAEWPAEASVKRPFGDSWRGYINEGSERIAIYGRKYKLGYGKFHSEDGGVLRAPDTGTLFNWSAYLYFFQGGVVEDDFSFAFSSSSTTLIGIVSGGAERPDILLTRDIAKDGWLKGNEIYFVDGSLDLLALRGQFKARADMIYAELEGSGWLSLESLFNIMRTGSNHNMPSIEVFKKYFEATFRSEYGMGFKHVYDKQSAGLASLYELRQAAGDYYLNIEKEPYKDMDEYMLVGMLTGVRPTR